MRVGLFIPCYVDAFEPEVGIATLELLERLGCTVEYPADQTCCGQPMTNTGCHQEAAGAEALFVRNFSRYDFIVAPSGSCVHQVRVNMTAIEQTPEVRGVRERTFELTEFLHDILNVSEFPWARFAHKIGLHYNCNSLRGINLASTSEIRSAPFSKPRALLEKVPGVEFVEPARWDECCGFGGTFSVFEPAVSVKMGQDKVSDHSRAGAEYIVSADSSCLFIRRGVLETLETPSSSCTSPGFSTEHRHERRRLDDPPTTPRAPS
jgi:L-lactate dehydrogenase complex protein LldE